MIFTKKKCFNSKYSLFKVFWIPSRKKVQEVFIFNGKKMEKRFKEWKNMKLIYIQSDGLLQNKFLFLILQQQRERTVSIEVLLEYSFGFYTFHWYTHFAFNLKDWSSIKK